MHNRRLYDRRANDRELKEDINFFGIPYDEKITIEDLLNAPTLLNKLNVDNDQDAVHTSESIRSSNDILLRVLFRSITRSVCALLKREIDDPSNILTTLQEHDVFLVRKTYDWKVGAVSTPIGFLEYRL